jgi:hypothetical protein
MRLDMFGSTQPNGVGAKENRQDEQDRQDGPNSVPPVHPVHPVERSTSDGGKEVPGPAQGDSAAPPPPLPSLARPANKKRRREPFFDIKIRMPESLYQNLHIERGKRPGRRITMSDLVVMHLLEKVGRYEVRKVG